MFLRLIFLFFIINEFSSGQTPEEILQFSKTPAWQKLIYFDGDESLVESDRFFIASGGKRDTLKELQATLNVFNSSQKNKEGQYYQCLFPARFFLLNQRWPGKLKSQECPDLKDWIQGLDAGDLYIVYSSAYPNNPASMFGHTFLRFDRKSKGKSAKEKSILGYSLAYQARTSPEDNAFEYTLKGVMGGYPAFLEVKPHYINLGVYNNLESRDLWEYPIPLTDKEKKYLILHAWELSLNVYFDYYFFDENCSTFLLRMLEVVRPDLDFQNKTGVFVVPQETLVEVVNLFKIETLNFVPSIKRLMTEQYTRLNDFQQDRFHGSKTSLGQLKNEQDPKVLDLLVDHWKYVNYKENTKLLPAEKTMMVQTFLKRSKVPDPSPLNLDFSEVEDNQAPHLGHDRFKFKFLANEKKYGIGFRYGFHDFYDSEIGYDKSSFINVLDLNYSGQTKKISATLLDIFSFQNFYTGLPAISWRAKLNYSDELDENKVDTYGLVGIGMNRGSLAGFFLTGLDMYTFQDVSMIRPISNAGFKYRVGEFSLISDVVFDFNIEGPKPGQYGRIEFKRLGPDYNIGLFYREQRSEKLTGIGVETYF